MGLIGRLMNGWFLFRAPGRNDIFPLVKDERGFALVIAMTIMIALTFLGLAAMMTTSIETELAGNYRRNKSAEAAADACIQDAFAQLVQMDSLTSVSGTGADGKARFRTPVPSDCVSNPGAIPATHPNAAPFGRPKPPYRDRRSGVFTPGMNVVKSGSGQAHSWGYKLYEVECEAWVPDKTDPTNVGKALARAVVRGSAGKLSSEGGVQSTEY